MVGAVEKLATPRVGAPLLCVTQGWKDGTMGPGGDHGTCTCVPLHHIFVSSTSSVFIAFLLILFFFSFSQEGRGGVGGVKLWGERQGLGG